MLTKMSLENFKSWQKAEIDLGRLTILFGTNSSGKSAVLHALLMLKQTVESFDRERALNFGGTERDYVDLGSYRDLVYGHDAKQHVGVGLHWMLLQPVFLADEIVGSRPIDYAEDGTPIYEELAPEISSEAISYAVRWDSLHDEVKVKRLVYGIPEDETFLSIERIEDSESYTYNTEDSTFESPQAFPAPESCYKIPYDVARFFMSARYLELLIFNDEFEALAKRIHYLGPLREHPKRTYLWTGAAPRMIGKQGEGAVEALIAANRHDSGFLEQISDWLRSLRLVEELKLSPIDQDRLFYQTRLRMPDAHIEDSLIDVGFGISQVLPVVVMLHLVPEGSIILLEQPELHLHPSAQAELADMFLQVAHERNLQLIVESHSEHLLVRLQRRIAENEHPLAKPEHIRLYFCEIGPEGSKATQVETNRFGQIKNWPQNFFGDRAAELDAMTQAALERRRQELSDNGNGGE